MVPLYGDMQINPFCYVNNKHVHYDPAKWPLMSGNSQSPESDILGKIHRLSLDRMLFYNLLKQDDQRVGQFVS